MSTWRLILNGKCTNRDDIREAVGALRKRGIKLGVRVTWEHGDVTRYVEEAIADRVDTVIAGGGDGTVNETVCTLMRAPDGPALAILPLGTANDFATAADIPLKQPEEALALIAARAPQSIDVLSVDADGEEHGCLNVATGGFGTRVTLETDPRLKEKLGGLAYVLTGLAKLNSIEPVRARFCGPGFEWEGELIVLAAGNGRQAGGGQLLCPDARVDDGLLDLTIVPELTGEVRTMLGALLSGGQQALREQVAVSARLPWIEIESGTDLHLNLDGEPVTAKRFRIECLPARLRMHLPGACPLLSS